jgi:hypothetical protein
MKKTLQQKRNTGATTPAATTNSQQIQAILKKPETILGVVVLVAAGILAANSIISSNNQTAATLPEFPEVTAEASTPATDSTAIPETNPSVEKVEVLANTSGTAVVIAKPGDTIWNLAQTYCGTDAATETIEKSNGYGRYKTLQAGDILSITCE